MFLFLFLNTFFFTETGSAFCSALAEHPNTNFPLVPLLSAYEFEIFLSQGLANIRLMSRPFLLISAIAYNIPLISRLKAHIPRVEFNMPCQSAQNNFLHLTFTSF